MLENSLDQSKIGINSEQSLTIGQLTEAVTNLTGKRCTSAMIYNYERLELLDTPDRSPGGFRIFRPVDVILVAQIKRWQEQGFSLTEIKEKLAENPDNLDEDLKNQDLIIDRKAMILEAAGEVFIQKGFSETTLQDIANIVGVSTALLYQYFNSKEDLFLSLIDSLSFIDIMEEMALPLELDTDITFEDVRASLIRVGNAFLDTHRPNADVMRLFISEVRRFPEIGESYCQRLIVPIEHQLENYFRVLIEQKIFRPLDVKYAVHAFFGIFLNFVFTQDLLKGGNVLDFSIEEGIPIIVDVFLAGVKNS